MGTMFKIKIENGKFVRPYDEHQKITDDWSVHQIFQDREYSAPWEVHIADGTICCHCDIIKKGTTYEQNILLPLKDGTLKLSHGRVGSRFVKFVDKSFTDYLDKYGIDYVKKFPESSTGIIVETCHQAHGVSRGSATYCLFTDGHIQPGDVTVADYLKNDDNYGCYSSDNKISYSICYATWYIKGVAYRYTHPTFGTRTNHEVIMYVKKGVDVTSIELPNEVEVYLKKFCVFSDTLIIHEIK